MTQEEMNRLVPLKLDELEKRHDIRVLLAVESGSQAGKSRPYGPVLERTL